MTIEQPIYAGFWVRVLAGLLDIVFLLPIFMILLGALMLNDFPLMQIIRFPDLIDSYENPYFDYMIYVVNFAYAAYFLSRKKQATLGKRTMEIYVGNRDGSKLSVAKSIARSLAGLFSAVILGLGYLPIIFTAEKTALHDLICNTRVFYGKRGRKNCASRSNF